MAQQTLLIMFGRLLIVALDEQRISKSKRFYMKGYRKSKFCDNLRMLTSLIVVAILTCSTVCDGRLTDIDLMEPQPAGSIFSLTGRFDGAAMGSGADGIGDFNGDGIDDFAAGSYGEDCMGRSAAGAFYVLYGKANYDVSGDLDAATFVTGSRGIRYCGLRFEDNIGSSLRAAGDFNNDGFQDIIVGSLWSSPMNRSHAGMAYVVFGHAAAHTSDFDLRLFENSSTTGFRVYGAVEQDWTSYSVCGAGDVNNDGYDDVLVGTPYALDAAGTTHLLLGHGNSTPFHDIDLLYFTSGVYGVLITGEFAHDVSGVSVSRAGDVDNDNFDDFIIGASEATRLGRERAGAAFLVFGRNNFASSMSLAEMSSSNGGVILVGATNMSGFGLSVSAAGDVNADGYDDIIIGAPELYAETDKRGAFYVFYGRARAGWANRDVHSFVSGSLGFAAHGEGASHFLGGVVSNAGDINRDGFADILVSAPGVSNDMRNEDGRAYLLYGRAGTYPAAGLNLTSLVPGVDGIRIRGRNDGDHLGETIAAAGDINHDGIDDFIVGGYRTDAADGRGSGMVFIVFGIPPSPTSQPSSQPSRQPSRQPTSQPSCQPSRQPSSQPSRQPSAQPSVQPSLQPTRQPSCQPSMQPSALPSCQPSRQPSRQPSSQPSSQPSRQPSLQPSAGPSMQPSRQPSCQPSRQPSCQPSIQPSALPSCQPSRQPSRQPSSQPSSQPSMQPSVQPSRQPSRQPTLQPSARPSMQPSRQPSVQPSCHPSAQPSAQPSGQPSRQPSLQPSARPSRQPSLQPSEQPSKQPTAQPSAQPSARPSSFPSNQPSAQPSEQPSVRPSSQPTSQPSGQPSRCPSSQPSAQPSATPSSRPTQQPSASPTSQPSGLPSSVPTGFPSAQPSGRPSSLPSGDPTGRPTSRPSCQPSCQPTSLPSSWPSALPTAQPSGVPSSQPSCQPTSLPSSWPSALPTAQPSGVPSSLPSAGPTRQPTCRPSASPSVQPSSAPSTQPSVTPSSQPSGSPSTQPSTEPSNDPTAQPTAAPSTQPTVAPTGQPVGGPTSRPSTQPTVPPTSQPAASPTASPSCRPSTQPTSMPSAWPTLQPSVQPSTQPQSAPTAPPSGSPSSQPSAEPTRRTPGTPSVPTKAPSRGPTSHPQLSPSCRPTAVPSRGPSASPTVAPSPLGGMNVTVLTVQVARTALTVKVQVSGEEGGFVYCAASRATAPSAAAPTASEIRRLNQAVFATPGNSSVVVLSDLVPATSYVVYCVGSTTSGSETTASGILRTRTLTATSCCKRISVRVLAPELNAGTSVREGIAVAVDFLPSGFFDVRISARIAGLPTSALLVFPSSLRFSNRTDGSKVQYATVSAPTAGSYELVVTATGGSAAEYEVVFVGRRNVSVLGAGQGLRAPVPMQAVFASDGSYVAVSFDAATDKAGVVNGFSCRTLLRFTGDTAATCQWTSPSQVILYTSFVEVASNITVLGGKLRAQCTRPTAECVFWETSAQSVLLIRPPSAPAQPRITLVVPASIGACSDMALDLSSSVGAAGRVWKTVGFTVRTNEGDAAAAEELQRFLQRNFTLASPTNVPRGSFQTGRTYSIQVTMCNFLLVCGTDVQSVAVSAYEDPIPVARIAGTPTRSVRRVDSLTLTAAAYVQDCAGVSSGANLLYAWSARVRLAGQSMFTPVALRSTSQSPAVFRLPELTLSVGAEYVITLLVSSSSSATTSTSTTIVVTQSAISASILGGSARYVQVGEMVTADASKTYDLDWPLLSVTQAGLVFAWSCEQLLPMYSPSCEISLSVESPAQAVVNISTPELSLQTTSVVTVTVSDATRSSSAQMRITVTSAPSPKLQITNEPLALVNVNVNDKLALLGSITPVASCLASWSVDDASMQLSSSARSPLMTTISPLGGSGAQLFNLVLGEGTLPERATLRFTLSCGGASTTVAVATNGGPLLGEFFVTPDRGEELKTLFSYSASGWTDPDLPLSFQFAFESAVSLSKLVIVSKSEIPHASGTLPAGPEVDAFAVIQYLQVYDSLGAATSSVRAVTVTPISAADKNTEYLKLIRSADGSTDRMKSAIAVVSTALNSANCSSARNCSALHRESCRMTAGMCGECLEGYLGDAGDRNAPCMPLTALTGDIGATCNVKDASCASWEMCDQLSSRCTIRPKSCGNNCTLHGVCIYTNTQSGRIQPACTLDDVSCEGVCSCADGYSGEFCELAAASLQQVREVRSNLVSSLRNLTLHEDINQESVAAWSSTLYSLSIRPYDLSSNDIMTVTAIANTTLQSALALGSTSVAELRGILQATDAVASVRRYNYNPNEYSDQDFSAPRAYENNTAAGIAPVVSKFGDLVSGSMTLGENATAFIYDNFRLSVTLQQVSPITGSFVATAPQPLQGSDRDASTVSVITGDQGSASTVVAVKLLTVYPRAYAQDTSAFVSTPLLVQIQAQSDPTVLPSSFVRTLNFTFQHDTPQERYLNSPAVNFTTYCSSRNASHREEFTCPGSNHVLAHNCSAGRGVRTSYCPKLAPACGRVDLASAEVSVPDTCSVVAFSADYTSCSCAVLGGGGGGGRRLGGTAEQGILDDTGAADMLATTTYIASDFADTFKAADNFTSPADAAAVIAVIVMLGVLWLPGLLLLSMTWLPSQSKEKSLTAKEGDARASVLAYVDGIIPTVFADVGTLAAGLWQEVKQHHVLFRVFADVHGAPKRREIICKTLTVFTFMLFLTAVFFDVSNPGNDGSCDGHTTSTSCLVRRSPFDDKKSYCRWVESDSGDEDSCVYDTDAMTIRALFYLTVLTTVITSLATVPLDYLFSVLSSPTAQSLQGTQVLRTISRMMAGARRLSNAGRNAVSTALTGGRPRKATHEVVVNREIPDSVARSGDAARQAVTAVMGRSLAMNLERSGTSKRWKEHAQDLRGERYGKSKEALKRPAAPATDAIRPAEPVAAHAQTEADIDSFLDEVILQRIVMKDNTATSALYDTQWGVHADPNAPAGYAMLETARSAVAEEIITIDQEALQLSAVIPNYTVQHAGLEILHAFMVDLLGRSTPAARIFDEKFGENFVGSRVVLPAQKYAAAAIVLGLNAFFIYYILLKAFQKGYHWQVQYIVCSVVQIAVDTLLFETTECVWLNYVVPGFVKTEVATAIQILKGLVGDVVPAEVEAESAIVEKPAFLNAPAHLFVSLKLAKAHPQLLESMIVACYNSYLPGNVCKTWPHYAPHLSREETFRDASTSSNVLASLRPLMRGLSLALQVFITVPYLYQRILLRFAQPVLFSGISIVWFNAINSTVGIAVLCVVSALAVLYAAWTLRRRRTAVADAGTEIAQASTTPVESDADAFITAAVAPPVKRHRRKGDHSNGRSSEDEKSDESDNSANSAAGSAGFPPADTLKTIAAVDRAQSPPQPAQVEASRLTSELRSQPAPEEEDDEDESVVLSAPSDWSDIMAGFSEDDTDEESDANADADTDADEECDAEADEQERMEAGQLYQSSSDDSQH